MGSAPLRHYMLTLKQICSHASVYTQPQYFTQIISAVYCDHPFPYYKIYSKIYDIPIVNGFTPFCVQGVKPPESTIVAFILRNIHHIIFRILMTIRALFNYIKILKGLGAVY